jgi:carbon monoxide dehydrogenase subunit G
VRFETSIDISATPARVWSVMADVERWREWTESISRIEKLTPGDLRVGSRLRIRQPKIPSAIWEVTVWEPERYFEWQNSGPAMRSIAGHRITPQSQGCRVELFVDQKGPAAGLLGLLLRRLANSYLQMEVTGLKRRSESIG